MTSCDNDGRLPNRPAILTCAAFYIEGHTEQYHHLRRCYQLRLWTFACGGVVNDRAQYFILPF